MSTSEAGQSKSPQRSGPSGSWLTRGLTLVCLGLLGFGQTQVARGEAGEPTAARQQRGQQNVADYTQSPREVGQAVTAALVQRGELPAARAEAVNTLIASATDRGERGQLSSQSMEVSREDLLDLVAEPFERFVGEAGGRYVVTVTVEPTAAGGARVTVIPTIIATVREADGPLGGRVLRSNGTLEAAILQSITASLGG